MLFHVKMTVKLPLDMDPAQAARLKADEKALAQRLLVAHGVRVVDVADLPGQVTWTTIAGWGARPRCGRFRWGWTSPRHPSQAERRHTPSAPPAKRIV